MNEIDIIQRWFRDSVRDSKGRPYILDAEQVAAVIDSHKNTLVSARAGAGKTHTLVAKIIYLIARLDYRPSEIMAFVFNKKAAFEINERLSSITVDRKAVISEDTEIARTFHSFAHRLVTKVNGRGSFGKILVDGELGADTDKSRTFFIQDMIGRMRDADTLVRDGIHDYFRNEAGKIENASFDSPEAYYRAIRNDAHLTLDGRSVKSFSEKIIADFFFEHGVAYRYEPEFYPSNFVKQEAYLAGTGNRLREEELIKADFFLTSQRIVWEHWAITGHETQQEIDDTNHKGVIGDYNTYLNKMNWKRWFYSKVWFDTHANPEKDIWYQQDFEQFVESYRDPHQSREDFEAELAAICHKNGIRLRYYSHEDLVKRAWKKQVKYFTEMVVQFIDRTEQQFYDDIDALAQRIASESSDTTDNARIKVFHQIGLKMYKEYLRRLSLRKDNGLMYVNKENQWRHFREYGTDFSMLLQEAYDILRRGAANHILEGLHVKMILVDEYQDFSRLFYDNLTALRAIFPESRLFCVGDDWQAINRFAGSDSEYFMNFDTYFPEDTYKLLIASNYRSAPEIVDNANHVMEKLLHVERAEFAKAANQHTGNAIIKAIDLRTVSLDNMPDDMRNRADLYRYITTISELIIKHKNDQRIIILHRNNKILINFSVWGMMKYHVRDYVTNTMKAMTKPQFDEKIRFLDDKSDIMTAHRSKGLEGDTVILLQVDPKTFPSSDGRNAFFSLFGDTPETHWEDEVHLYYVALTRAKTNLYVLWGTYPHNPGDEPEFIAALEQTMPVSQTSTHL